MQCRRVCTHATIESSSVATQACGKEGHHAGRQAPHHAPCNVQRHLQPPPLVRVEGGGAVQQLEQRAPRHKLCDDAEVGRLCDGSQLQHSGRCGGMAKVQGLNMLALRQQCLPSSNALKEQTTGHQLAARRSTIRQEEMRQHSAKPGSSRQQQGRQEVRGEQAGGCGPTHKLHDVWVAQSLHDADFLAKLIKHL